MESLKLHNQFLIAQDVDPLQLFKRSVIYICDHSEEGTMGLAINRPTDLRANDIFSSMEIVLNNETTATKPVLAGGPVQENVGFVLHNAWGKWHSSIQVADNIAITTSKDILHAIANEEGPEHSLLILGYSGWGPGQLEEEIQNNYWLTYPAQESIIFNTPFEKRWEAAIRLFGIDPTQLVNESGHA